MKHHLKLKTAIQREEEIYALKHRKKWDFSIVLFKKAHL